MKIEVDINLGEIKNLRIKSKTKTRQTEKYRSRSKFRAFIGVENVDTVTGRVIVDTTHTGNQKLFAAARSSDSCHPGIKEPQQCAASCAGWRVYLVSSAFFLQHPTRHTKTKNPIYKKLVLSLCAAVYIYICI